MKRSKFNLSFSKLFSCDMGYLIPMGWTEVIPGDSFQASTNCLIRTQPLLAPVMHPVDVRIHHWYVPLRLIWNEFEDFITAGPAGTSTPVRPYHNIGSTTAGSLYDYLGLPVATYTAPVIQVSSLAIRAYYTIWNEWYRDQDLQTEEPVSLSSGPDSTAVNNLKRVSWEKDRYTSARPWEQKGPAVTIPLGTSAPVTRVSNAGAWRGYEAGTNTLPAGATADLNLEAATGRLQANTGQDYSLDPNGGLIADLTSASAITVSNLREALALQRFEEARARYGSRYTEYLRYLGVQSSDARLQRPEYLGGGRQTIQFSEVLQTAADGANPVGSLRGHGIAAMRSNRYRRFFEEHGIVMSMFSVRPKTIYMSGIDKKFLRLTKEDYWQRELEHIGQEEVYNKEVYVNHTNRDSVFGYIDRYDTYRRSVSSVSGQFTNSTLNFWHLARDFSSDPALNSAFVSCVPTERVFPTPAQDVLYVMARHRIGARRLVSGSSQSFIY